MMDLFAAFPLVHGVRLVGPPSAFEERYAAVRAREQRILSDVAVRKLPDGSGLWNAGEWKIRARSAQRLASVLGTQGTALKILEVGCGNGWLSALLQSHGHHTVGIDVFTSELEQAARVFPNGPVFARCDPFDPVLAAGYFDAVVFAASIQYFADVDAIIDRALELTVLGGGVHVLDSILYESDASARAAATRSRAYFTELGVPAMANGYNAHTLASMMDHRGGEVLHAPDPRWHRIIGRGPSPFFHVVVRKG